MTATVSNKKITSFKRELVKKLVKAMYQCLYLLRLAKSVFSIDSKSLSNVSVVYFNSTMGFGDYLMASAFLRSLESAGKSFVVCAPNFNELFSNFARIDRQEFMRSLGKWDNVFVMDVSFRSPRDLIWIILKSRFVGFIFDLRCRSFADGFFRSFEAITMNDPWQMRVELLCKYKRFSTPDFRYYLGKGTGEICVAKNKLVVMSPFSLPLFRMFDFEVILKIQRELLSKGYRVVIIGEKQFSAFTNRFISEGVENLIGNTSFKEMIELIKSSCAFIGLDSGPMHLALALGKPTFGMFKAVAPQQRVPEQYNELFFSCYLCEYLVAQPCYKPNIGYPIECKCTDVDAWVSIKPKLEGFLAKIGTIN